MNFPVELNELIKVHLRDQECLIDTPSSCWLPSPADSTLVLGAFSGDSAQQGEAFPVQG